MPRKPVRPRPETVGDRIALAIRQSGIESDAEVARRAGVKASWLGAVKQDRIANPDLVGLKGIAEACGKTLGWLLAPTGLVPLEEVNSPDQWIGLQAAVLAATARAKRDANMADQVVVDVIQALLDKRARRPAADGADEAPTQRAG